MNNWKHNIKKAMVYIWKYYYSTNLPRAVILCYHSIHPTYSFRSCTPEIFEKQLRWLKKYCTMVPLETIFCRQHVDIDNVMPKVALTFDDGYVDNYNYAFPLLLKYTIPATFFVTVGFLERNPCVMQKFQYFRHTSLEELEPLTWRQVQEMKDAGMKFGAHTYSHANLACLERPQLEFELKQAKTLIEDRIGQPVNAFAYPFGKPRRHFDASTLEVLQEAGYEYAVSALCRGVLPRDSRWALPRLFVTSDDPLTLEEKVSGNWDFLGCFQEWSPPWLARIVSPKDFQV